MRTTEPLISKDSEYFFSNTTNISQKLFYYPLICGRFTYLPGYHMRRERYDSYLMILVEKGQLWADFSGKIYHVYPGQVLLINCYTPHSYGSDDGAKLIWLHFDGRLCNDFYEEIVNTHGNVITPKNSHVFSHAMNEIYSGLKTNSKSSSDGDYSLLIHALLIEALSSDNTNIIGNNDAFQKVLSYISAHLSESISVKELAGVAGLTEYYFLRAFKKKIGMTPHQYIIDARLSCAKYYLSSTRLSIAEIAEMTGFTDESSFCHTFKIKNHITPLTYRNGATK